MFLKIIILVIFIYFLNKSIESIQCKDVVIEDPPLASVYDITYNKSKKKYVNHTFESEYTSYKSSLKQYINGLTKYCNVN